MPIQINASRQVVMNIKGCLQNGVSFNQETTLAGRSIISTVKRARARGYIVNLKYVFVTQAEIAKARVLERLRQGGHRVPDELIERRFGKSLENLK
ncbi:MAG: zeta toxin family protein [Clostridiales bacterium]|jgi:predicted ABC-type ATPase|nr:zeta toxin family protein [Clostridiales bacterium]